MQACPAPRLDSCWAFAAERAVVHGSHLGGSLHSPRDGVDSPVKITTKGVTFMHPAEQLLPVLAAPAGKQATDTLRGQTNEGRSMRVFTLDADAGWFIRAGTCRAWGLQMHANAGPSSKASPPHAVKHAPRLNDAIQR